MINELIDQIGGRERLEQYAFDKHMCNINEEIRLMARALLAVLDAQEKPAGTVTAYTINGVVVNRCKLSIGDKVYTTPPAASVPGGLAAAVNLLLDSDGSRGTFSAIRRGNALAEVERLLAAAPASSVTYALCEAVNAIYFNDSSDYLSALWSVVRALSPETADLFARDERAAFERVNANIKHAASPAPGGDGG